MTVYVVTDQKGDRYEFDNVDIVGVYSTKELAIDKIEATLGDSITSIIDNKYHYDGFYDYNYMTYYEKQLI